MSAALNAGKLRKRVAVQTLPAPQATNAAWNEPTFSDWQTVAVRWASIEPLTGREMVYAGQVAADATHTVTVRYYKGLTARMRFLYTDDATGVQRVFNVEYVKDPGGERHVTQECLCHEAAP